MKSKKWIVGTTATLVAGIMATAAQAAPITNSVTDLRATSAVSSIVDKTASRRCWWRNGRRHCAWYGGSRVYGYRNGGSDYYERNADKLPYGTSRWWDQMLRENRAGNPGGGGRN